MMTTPKHGQTKIAPIPSRTSGSKMALHSLFETIVFVHVGPEQKRYHVHKGLLYSRSGYFEAALMGNFREAEDQVVTLDDEDPETFRTFNAWLYTDVLVEDAGPEVTSFRSLFNVYLFAEKRIIPLLQNAAIDAIIRANVKISISANEIRRARTRTAETSLLVDSMLQKCKGNLKDQFQNHIDQYDITFVAAVAIRAAELFTLERKHLDAKQDPRSEILTWVGILCNPWRVRCTRYHIHYGEDALCTGSI